MLRNNPGNARACPGLQAPMLVLLINWLLKDVDFIFDPYFNRGRTSDYLAIERHYPSTVYVLHCFLATVCIPEMCGLLTHYTLN